MTRLLDHNGDPLGPEVVNGVELFVPPPPADPLAMIAIAVQKGVDPDQLGKLMDLYERVENRRALDAFNEAMSACQAEMPPIPYNDVNSLTKSQYTNWTGLNKLIKPTYTKHGFALVFGEIVHEPPLASDVHYYVDVAHRAGHTKRIEGIFPRDGVGIKGNSNMTPLQGVASTRSYAKRNLAKEAFDLAEGGEDTDGGLADTLLADEVDEINELLIRNCRDKTGMLRWLGGVNQDGSLVYPSVEQILRKDFSKVKYELQRKKGATT